MNEFWQKRVLVIAAAWNVLGGTSALFDPARHFAQLYSASLSLNEPLQAFFFRCTWINVIAWGVAYLLAVMLPGARSAVMLAGGAGKLAYSGACVALHWSGVGGTMLLVAASVDLVFACLFAAAVLYNRKVRS